MAEHPRGEPPPAETTADLLALVRNGDARARDRLFAKFIPVLKRLAHGRMPGCARGVGDTEDLVQVTLRKAFEHMNGFEHRGEGAFLAYLRQIMVNEVRDQARWHKRRPTREPLDVDLPDPQPSPVEHAIGREALQRYEAGLAELPSRARDAIILRVEGCLTYEEIAREIDAPSAEAARQIIKRSLKKLAERMNRERP